MNNLEDKVNQNKSELNISINNKKKEDNESYDKLNINKYFVI